MLFWEMNVRWILMLSSSVYSGLGDVEDVEITLVRNVGDFYQSIRRKIVEKWKFHGMYSLKNMVCRARVIVHMLAVL
jgi:hypothetical protein